MEPREDDDLRALMADPTPLSDDGFTARVMDRLPRRHSRSVRAYILSGTTLLACVLGLLLPSIRETIFASVVPVLNASLPVAAVAVLMVLAFATYVAFAEET